MRPIASASRPSRAGVGEARLHRGDERLEPAHRPGHLRGAGHVGDGVQPGQAPGGSGRVGQLDGDGVGRGVHGEFKLQVTGGRRGRDRPARHVGSQPRRLEVGAPQGVQHRRADPGQKRRIGAGVGQRDGLPGQPDAPGPGHLGDENLGQQGEEPGARGRIGVGHFEGGLDERDLRGGSRAEPEEPAVGGQGGLRHDRGRTTAPGQRRRFGQGREGARIAGLLLGVAEPDEQTSALAIGDIEGGAVVERRPVPVGRLGRRQLPGRVIAGRYRPASSFGEHPAQVVLRRDLSRRAEPRAG